ncbi:MAG: glycosyltransferase family 1 protein [Pleurocapsa sp.]
MMEPKVVIDAIFFQIANSGIARVWRSIFREWSESFLLEGAVIIDRDKTCPLFDGFIYEDMPRYDFVHTANDVFAIEEICQKHQADIFISTYYTTPVSVPSLMMVYDMIPERFGFDMSIRGWREKDMAIRHASGFLSISHSTAKDLLELYPEIPPQSVKVAHCGVDRRTFYPRTAAEISSLRAKYGVKGDYYLFVGSRSQMKGYKNAQLFFNSLSQVEKKDFSIVCIGGQAELEDYIKVFTSEIDIHLLYISDEELSVFYSDAIALVYPSLYEGFGLPIIEAMACGCPVITTKAGSIPEAAGEAAYSISGMDEGEMARAIVEIRKPQVREDLITKGITHAANFTWRKMADITYDAIMKMYQYKDCYQQAEQVQHWQEYRQLLQQLQ